MFRVLTRGKAHWVSGSMGFFRTPSLERESGQGLLQ